MKKLIYLTLFLPIFLISCESDPEASFFMDSDVFEVGHGISFNNSSQNATSYEWDFGDGYISYEANPVHYYQVTGTYEVTLTAISKKGMESKAVMSIKLVEPSLLVIEVLEYWDNYTVADASVILYPSESDWDNQQNMIMEGFTGEDGVVVFANLDPIVHYVDVWENNHDNYQLRAEDVGFIKTQKIIPQKVQVFVAYVDYVQHTKGNGRTERKMVIKKLERKAVQPVSAVEIKDWQELYNRRVNK
jgi:PKD repeat protein